MMILFHKNKPEICLQILSELFLKKVVDIIDREKGAESAGEVS